MGTSLPVPAERESPGEPLSGYTTMGVGGPANRMVVVTSTDELVDAVREVDDADEPLLVVGGGSNLLVGDQGFPGTVVLVRTSGITVESSDACSGATVRVAAGHVWDEVVEEATAQGWVGIETLAGIPGSTGATPIQNVGAYGQEVAQTIASVRVWDRREQRVVTIAAADCGFGYRSSRFKEHGIAMGRHVVLDVLFQLRLGLLSAPVRYADLAGQLEIGLGERAPLADVRDAVLAQRARRGMVLDPTDRDTNSCGSFFTNPLLTEGQFGDLAQRVAAHLGPDHMPPRYAEPDGRVKTSAAWLIERAGFGKGFGLPGPAALSTKHSLAVTNRGGATAREVVALARTVRDGVEATFGVRLVNEPVLVGLNL